MRLGRAAARAHTHAAEETLLLFESTQTRAYYKVVPRLALHCTALHFCGRSVCVLAAERRAGFQNGLYNSRFLPHMKRILCLRGPQHRRCIVADSPSYYHQLFRLWVWSSLTTQRWIFQPTWTSADGRRRLRMDHTLWRTPEKCTADGLRSADTPTSQLWEPLLHQVPATRLAILSPEFSIAAAELWWTLVEQLEREGETAHIKRRRDGTCAKHRDGSFAHTVGTGGAEEVRSRSRLP